MYREPYTYKKSNITKTGVSFAGISEATYKSFHEKFQKGFTRPIEFENFMSYSLYPKVFEEAHEKYKKYGSLCSLPTKNFFFGMEPREEIMVEIEPGKQILIKCLAVSSANEDGYRTVFFKVNGENKYVDVKDQSLNVSKEENIKADPESDDEIGAPLQGLLYKLLVKKGQEVQENDSLFVIEAMKMETTVVAPKVGRVDSISLKEGAMVVQDDLILTLV
ncbi:biotin/lipoyl-containing protein [Flagellimonas onchidii]|uniref:biotin/lipoyl-containing protein n=1 Tax=Flagellimonas onchidii TaxID=2562684 RepID=UPI0028BEB166|nr:biotin/lipoyl-containing protein [Allomuricauda onchidii]